ncbi:hypothetical protein BpHYR1_022108 [Brachionus plicatilis]|uniref:Uncharacterized protein n=1 Tax=Brachionus plicatilis TaxID=10195 RepID=A0A3M7SQH9_BRAPC|nr:hypothetical protein BpHYR1_022108 [Brachionus plicatilis]
MDELASNLNSLELHSTEPSDEKAAITLSQKKSPQLYHLGYYFKRSYASKETTKLQLNIQSKISKLLNRGVENLVRGSHELIYSGDLITVFYEKLLFRFLNNSTPKLPN